MLLTPVQVIKELEKKVSSEGGSIGDITFDGNLILTDKNSGTSLPSIEDREEGELFFLIVG